MMNSKALLFSLALPLLLVACKKQQQSQQGGPPAAAVTVAQPTQKEVMEWDEYPGRLEATEMVEIRARVNGYLQSINFKDGAEVKKGDLLFVIDPRPYQAELDRAKAELVQAETKLELAANDAARAEKLLKAKAIAEEEADSRNKAKREAEAMIQSAKAMVEVANLNLDYTQSPGSDQRSSGAQVDHGGESGERQPGTIDVADHDRFARSDLRLLRTG